MSHYESVSWWLYTLFTNDWFYTLGKGTCEFTLVDNWPFCTPWTSGKSELAYIITNHPFIFARFYWLLFVMWCKISGRLSRNNPQLGNICPPVSSVQKKLSRRKKNQPKNFIFSSLLFSMNNIKLVLKFPGIAILKRKWSQIHIRHQIKQLTRNMKSNERVTKYLKSLSGLLSCRLIMSLAEIWSLKFYIIPRSFASRPNGQY